MGGFCTFKTRKTVPGVEEAAFSFYWLDVLELGLGHKKHDFYAAAFA